MFHTLKSGDHVIMSDDVYGGTNRYARLYGKAKFGIDLDFVDMTKVENIEKVIKPETKLIWIETPTNPTMKIVDIKVVVDLAKKHKITTLCDNTFCSPYLQSPLLLGVDIAYASLTKYMGGHSDVVMGSLVTSNEDLHKQFFAASCSIGANPSPFDCFLMNRGIKTLPIRIFKSTHNGYHLAHYMEKH